MRFFAVLLMCILAVAAAFQAPSSLHAVKSVPAKSPFAQTGALKMAEDFSWSGDFPPSKVLGPVGSKMPSFILGPLSLIFFVTGTWACHQSNILTIPDDTLNVPYFLASWLVPISWGTHVAAWIQKKNGK